MWFFSLPLNVYSTQLVKCIKQQIELADLISLDLLVHLNLEKNKHYLRLNVREEYSRKIYMALQREQDLESIKNLRGQWDLQGACAKKTDKPC